MIDWKAAALAAHRSNAAYQTTPDQSKAAFTALGDDWIDLYTTGSTQAALSVDSQGVTHLSISGTRASAGYLADIFRDVSLIPKKVKGGTVTEGVIAGMDDLWAWVLDTVPQANPISVAGHSLGAARSHLTSLYLPADRIGAIHSLEAPRFLAADYYATYAKELANMVCVLCESDLWAAWYWFDAIYGRPQPEHVWIRKAGGFQMIPASQWPAGKNPADHDIDLVCRLMDAIAAADVKPAA